MKTKNILLVLALVILSTPLMAQATTTNTDPSAALEVDSTTQGFLLPRMTTAQRDAITSPAAGLIIFNTSTGLINFYDGLAWIDLEIVISR